MYINAILSLFLSEKNRWFDFFVLPTWECGLAKRGKGQGFKAHPRLLGLRDFIWKVCCEILYWNLLYSDAAVSRKVYVQKNKKQNWSECINRTSEVVGVTHFFTRAFLKMRGFDPPRRRDAYFFKGENWSTLKTTTTIIQSSQ